MAEEDSTTNERGRQEAEGHACSLMHRYRAVDTVVRTCRLSGQLQEKSSSSTCRLSKLRKHDLEDNRISLSTVGSKQSFLTEAFNRVKHRYESGTASESTKRAHVFAGLHSSVHSSVSFGGSGLLITAPKHFEAFAVELVRFKVRRRCDNVHQSRMKSTCLLCSLQRMHDGWSKLISNFQPPIKAAPQQCPQKAHVKC